MIFVVGKPAHQVNVQIKRGLKFPFRRGWLCAVCKTVLEQERVKHPVEVECVITNDATMRELNRTFRSIDDTTDVLSFALKEVSGIGQGGAFPATPGSPEMLGQVVISFPTAVNQARIRRRSLDRELAILLVHGMLHLLNYDHQTPAEARRMRRRELASLKRVAALRGPL